MMGSSSAARLVFLSALVLLATRAAPVRAADAGAAPAKPPAPVAAKPPAAGVLAKPATKAKAAKKPKNTTVVLFHMNRRDTMTLRMKDAQGRPIKGQQRRFDRFLRCHYTNKQHAMNPRLLRVLYQTGRHWPGKRLEVVSGYRNPSVAKNPHSPHMKGVACDFRVAGVKNTELRDYLRGSLKKVGVGYYPNSSFVHLDVRKDRSAFWIDYSGPGERSQYSENAAEDLKTGRADSYKPTKIGDDWLNDAPSEGAPPSASGAQGTGATAPEKIPAAPAVQGTLAGQPGQPQPSATP